MNYTETFKYISCYSLSECMRVLKPDGVYFNTSHVILYRTDRIRRRKGCAFKYISCYSLSLGAVVAMAQLRRFKYISCYSLSE